MTNMKHDDALVRVVDREYDTVDIAPGAEQEMAKTIVLRCDGTAPG
jgi:hypothetical protein